LSEPGRARGRENEREIIENERETRGEEENTYFG